jgi:hypothetical protein
LTFDRANDVEAILATKPFEGATVWVMPESATAPRWHALLAAFLPLIDGYMLTVATDELLAKRLGGQVECDVFQFPRFLLIDDCVGEDETHPVPADERTCADEHCLLDSHGRYLLFVG